ncbi:hypothetical protein [Paracoccus sp. J39]|nr:hypothetical protein [Paracoccus sp. J39]
MQSCTVSSRIGPISPHGHPRPRRDLTTFEELHALGLKGLADGLCTGVL